MMPAQSIKTQQRGAALVIGLLLLLVITILAVAIIQVVTLQERMSRNLRDQTVAFQSAETALRAAEDAVNLGNVTGSPFKFARFTSACTVSLSGVTHTGFCLPSSNATPQWKAVSWAAGSTGSVEVSTPSPPTGVTAPRYMIELISGKSQFIVGKGCTSAVFRISARGFGPNNAVSTIQSVYRYRVPSC
jgi:type IV pilus assembly protein PilX